MIEDGKLIMPAGPAPTIITSYSVALQSWRARAGPRPRLSKSRFLRSIITVFNVGTDRKIFQRRHPEPDQKFYKHQRQISEPSYPGINGLILSPDKSWEI
jgi:hypothetical protein